MKNNDFAVFIMVHGRPDKVFTYNTLRKQGYTGKIYLVADDLDETIEGYKKKYKNELIIIDIKKAAIGVDTGDNSGDLNSTLFKSNKIFDLAEERLIKNFCIMCDDYYYINYAIIGTKGLVIPKDLNKIFDLTIQFYKKINAKSIAFAQTGDFIGGIDNEKGVYRFSKRKVMNTMFCSTERRFEFMGRMNEDVTTYTNLGTKGELFLTIPVLALSQKDTQQRKGGLSGLYKDNGTYVKSFYTVMYNPSCVKVKMMNANHKRIHHSISWNNAVACIIDEKHKK